MSRWYESSTVYQIYPMSFKDTTGNGIGDIKGIIEKLPYLESLGVDILWLSPLYVSPMDDNGYDIEDYEAINPLFGTMDDFKMLLHQAHARKMKIIMDLVINHTSDEHVYFKQARLAKNNPYHDYYIWRDPVNGGPPNDQQSVFSGPAWTFDERTQQYYFHLFSTRQPDLNWDNPKLKAALYAMINRWLDLGIDGFRLDVIDLIGKDVDAKRLGCGPYLDERLNELYERCFKDKGLFIVGETPTFGIEEANRFTALKRPILDMVFHFQHVGLDERPGEGKWALKPLDPEALKTVLFKWQLGLQEDGWNSLYWSNHDQPRAVSRFGCESTYREQSAKMLAGVLHGMRGTPFIYQGEELGLTNSKMTNLEDYRDLETLNVYKELKSKGWDEATIMEAIKAKSRDNVRTPMPWSSQPYSGFSTVKPWLKTHPKYQEINVEEALSDTQSVWYFYRDLIALRKKEAALARGRFEVLSSAPQVIAYTRTEGLETITVIGNLTHQAQPSISVKGTMLLTNYKPNARAKMLRPYEIKIIKTTGEDAYGNH